MTMKKDRKKGRLLKKELKELRRQNAVLLEWNMTNVFRDSDATASIRNRIRCIQVRRVFSLDDIMALRPYGDKNPMKDIVVKDLLNSDCLYDMVHVYADQTFKGAGTALIATLECLTPLYD